MRPTYSMMTVADALKRDWSGWALSRKMDGCFSVREFGGYHVTGEAMRDGTFHPFDIAMPGDWREREERIRAAVLQNSNWRTIPTGNGVEFIEAMIALARADGTPDVAVAKPLEAAFGESLVKIKLVETYDCTVTDADGSTNSVAICFENQNAGRVSVRGPERDNLRVGDWIEIAGTLLPSGKFREPRFIRARPDKNFTQK